MSHSQKTLVVYGDGLAGLIAATALAGRLSAAYRIVLIADQRSVESDFLYGGVTSPTGYDFYRGLGLDEPTLFLKSATAFSFGTYYRQWPAAEGDWVQSHHQPLPVIAGVPLHHHLSRHKRSMAPLLVSTQAAAQGKFAHPPEDPSVPLSRAEYGYQFSADEWRRMLATLLRRSRVEICEDAVEKIDVCDGEISGLTLVGGARLQADLYVDASGPSRRLMAALGVPYQGVRSVKARFRRQAVEGLGPACRLVTGSENGYVSQTHLQGAIESISIAESDSTPAGIGALNCQIGRLETAWSGNCLAIGHAASVLDPVTPAPMMLLQRDIERLLDLIPIGPDHAPERREFNRRFENDATHTGMFGDALYQTKADLDSDYWRQAKRAGDTAGLRRKIAQFEHRGVLVRFDLEPFNDEDWLILHHGMGRRPIRYDLQVKRAPKADVVSELDSMTRAIEQMVSRLPPHDLYVSNMKRYLEKQKNV